MVYTTSSIALAVLEVLAYRHATKALPPRHLYTVDVEDDQITRLGPDELPEDWDAYPHSESSQRLGDAWVGAGERLGLAVPSVLASPEVNVILNCLHPDFVRLQIEGPELFPLNPRLTPDAKGK